MRKIIIILLLFIFNSCYFHHLKYIDLEEETDDKWEEIGIDESNTKKDSDKKKDR